MPRSPELNMMLKSMAVLSALSHTATCRDRLDPPTPEATAAP